MGDAGYACCGSSGMPERPHRSALVLRGQLSTLSPGEPFIILARVSTRHDRLVVRQRPPANTQSLAEPLRAGGFPGLCGHCVTIGPAQAPRVS